MNILIGGSTGLLGERLVKALKENGHTVGRLVRGNRQTAEAQVKWIPSAGQLSAGDLEGYEAVVNLAGENIFGLWTESKKRAIRESRVQSTKLLAETMAKMENKPRVFVCASAMGYYGGDNGAEPLTEDSPPGDDFLAHVCVDWEKACDPAREAGIRVANMRFAIVLSKDGGALKSMLPPFKLGLGGPIGDGTQYFPWVHIDDAVGAIVYALEHDDVSGPVNVSAPVAPANKDFVKTLGRVLGRPTALRVPAMLLKLAPGDMADQMFLASYNLIPTRLTQNGYAYKHPELEEALRTEVT